MLEISLKAEKILQIGFLTITNTLVASTVVVLFFLFITWRIVRSQYNLKSRFYNFVEMLVEGFSMVIESVVGRGTLARRIFPIIVTFFLFIMFNNWFGIAPGTGSIGFWEPKHHVESTASGEHETQVSSEKENVTNTTRGDEVPSELSPASEHAENVAVEKNETAEKTAEKSSIAENKSEAEQEMIFVPLLRSANSDLNMTLAIAIFSVIFIQVIGIKTLGLGAYLHKFFNFSDPILLFVGLLEIVSECVKVFSFSFRLFGNIFAGDVLLVVISGLVPYIAPIPFLGIEMFAGLIQALIFSMLTLVFIKTSVAHGEH